MTLQTSTALKEQTVRMFHFVRNFPDRWPFQVALGKEVLDVREQLNGRPQGSVLGPTLFPMVMDSLFKFGGRNRVKLLVYADDVMAYSEDKDPSVVQENLQNFVNDVGEWSRSTGPSISGTRLN
jgi:hypothetical protein